ncbi:MAG: SAM-dependent methyltransferase, partial [Lachnospiraceae bacterium]
MEQFKKLIEDSFNIDFRKAIFSNPRKKESAIKVKVRPILKKEVLFFQCERFENQQVFHENLEADQAKQSMLGYMEEFKQLQLETKEALYTVMVSKKGKVTI